MSHRFTLLFALVAGSCGMCHAQSFNIDLDEMGGTELTGNGAPSPAFGGAPGQPGTWNRIDAAGPITPAALLDLSGAATGAQIFATSLGGSLYGGYNNPNLSGDFRLLMADGRSIGQPVQYHFTGLEPGSYRIYTYGAPASGTIRNLLVSVPGSSTSTQTVSGPMPANLFVYGLDYCYHDLTIAGTSLEVDVTTDSQFDAEIHGFQLVHSPVSEPTCLIVFGGSLISLARRRRTACR